MYIKLYGQCYLAKSCPGLYADISQRGGGEEGANLGVFKKEGGIAVSSVRGSTGRQE